MPEVIITETCPAPECNLSAHSVEQMVEELATYHGQFAEAFGCIEQMELSRNNLAVSA